MNQGRSSIGESHSPPRGFTSPPWILLVIHYHDKTPTSHYTLGVKDPKIFPRYTFLTETVSRSCQLMDDQPTVHVTSGVEGKDTHLCRASDSTEPFNDPALVARSSTRRSDPIPSPYLDEDHTRLFDTFFLQIIPLSIRYTPTPGTIFTTLSPQALRFHTPGTSDPQSLATSNHVVRTEQTVLRVSLNTQSQATDIPVVSSRAAFSRCAVSLQDQSKVPDLHSLSSSTEELWSSSLSSFNTQSKVPDIHFVVCVFGRSLGFFLHPKSSSR